MSDFADVHEIYTDPKNDPWLTTVAPILRLMPRRDLASAAGLSERSIQAARNVRSRPRARKLALLTHAAAEYARFRLPEPIADDFAACAAFLAK